MSDDPCNEVVVNELKISYLKDGLKIYPNPTANLLYIEYDEVDSYCIVDLHGRTIIPEQSISNQVIDVSELNPALYFILFYQDHQLLSSRTIQIVDP